MGGVMATTEKYVQLGFEVYEGGERKQRFTPLDLKVSGNAQAVWLFGMVLAGMDATDIQPGDGEFDVALPKNAIKSPWIQALIPKDALPNLFIRLQDKPVPEKKK